jgi:hypothetical protein
MLVAELLEKYIFPRLLLPLGYDTEVSKTMDPRASPKWGQQKKANNRRT